VPGKNRPANPATLEEAVPGAERLGPGPQLGGRSALPPTGKTDVGLMKGRQREARDWRDRAGAWRGESGKRPKASGPDHPGGPEEEATRREARLGLAAWPEGPS
jgi:hypothetical protein